MFKQVLDPVGGSLGLSALCAAIPLITLFVLLGVVRLAAQRGLPVLCQKPLAPALQEAIELAAEVKDQTRLMVHENWRFRGYYP